METQSDKVKCLECGKYFKKLGGGHLEKIHKMSVADYKRKHPGAKTASRSFIEKQKEDKRRQYADKSLGLRRKVGERTFDFVENKNLKWKLQRDLRSAKICLKNGLWKPSIILYGAIIEAVLVEMNPNKDKGFSASIEWAKKKGIINEQTYHQIHIVRDLRNYVHLHKELEEKKDINDYWAKTFAEICELIISRFRG